MSIDYLDYSDIVVQLKMKNVLILNCCANNTQDENSRSKNPNNTI